MQMPADGRLARGRVFQATLWKTAASLVRLLRQVPQRSRRKKI
jgi:hypothetical protein